MLWDALSFKGYAIEASDGRLGTVTDLLFEDVGWVVRWLVVDTGNWLPRRKVLSRQKIKNAPSYNPTVTVDGAYDERFLTYYGIRWVEG